MEPENQTALNKNSYISISCVVLIIGATIWLRDGQARGESLANEVKAELTHSKEVQGLRDEILNAKVDNLLGLVKSSGEDRFTGRDHKVFVERLHELNPALKVPNYTSP